MENQNNNNDLNEVKKFIEMRRIESNIPFWGKNKTLPQTKLYNNSNKFISALKTAIETEKQKIIDFLFQEIWSKQDLKILSKDCNDLIKTAIKADNENAVNSIIYYHLKYRKKLNLNIFKEPRNKEKFTNQEYNDLIQKITKQELSNLIQNINIKGIKLDKKTINSIISCLIMQKKGQKFIEFLNNPHGKKNPDNEFIQKYLKESKSPILFRSKKLKGKNLRVEKLRGKKPFLPPKGKGSLTDMLIYCS